MNTGLSDFYVCAGSHHRPLKRQTKITAEDILIFYFYLWKTIWLDFSCESSA